MRICHFEAVHVNYEIKFKNEIKKEATIRR